jgi:RNA polymerase sigma-70 factor (ECF subfamily)
VGDVEIRDDQLRMMFACASPSVPPEAQVAVILKYLCGFGVGEIAQAFLTSPAAVEKRLARAKRTLKRAAIVELPGAKAASRRLDSVQQALYLLFSEGYHGSHPERAVREELCAEALRLASLLSDHPATASPSTFALLALLCLHAARLPSRIDDAGSLVLLEAQDRSRWSRPLIEEGIRCLGRSAEGPEITPLHLEAAIAAHHARAASFAETDWPAIADLYSKLLELRPSPVVALNRAIAIGRVVGPDEGLRELDRIRGGRRLKNYPFLEAAAGDLHQRAGRIREAKVHFGRAVALARNESERKVLESRRSGL